MPREGRAPNHPAVRAAFYLAALLLTARENPRVISERLGHARVTLARHTYSHARLTLQRAMVERLNAILHVGR